MIFGDSIANGPYLHRYGRLQRGGGRRRIRPSATGGFSLVQDTVAMATTAVMRNPAIVLTM
ncbi:MAG: hypothetical protein FJ312_03980 [SAR202 cluster bacterium]|nr:hypothetical protein [SAR202 cluster bacterium]